MRQCDGAGLFPWSRNACGIYSSLGQYIPNNCMLSHNFDLLPLLLLLLLSLVQERGPITTLTLCTCQHKQWPSGFTVALYSPLNCWHFRIRWSSLCCAAFTYTQSHPCCLQPVFIGAECGFWAARLPPDGTPWYCKEVVPLEKQPTI